MAGLDETEQAGIWASDNEDSVVRHAELVDQDSINGEKVIMCLYVADLSRKTFDSINKSGAQAHTLKIYHFPFDRRPESISEKGVKQVHSEGVAAGAQSTHVVLENDYIWLIVTITSGAIETKVIDVTFQGSRLMR